MDQQPVETTLYSLKATAPEPQQRRADERHLSLLRVGALMIEGRRELCLIRNISAGGMMIRAYSDIREGTEVAIELKQGEPVKGLARWVNDDNIGVEFAEPIDVIDLISASGDGPRPRKPRIEVGCGMSLRQDGAIHRARAVNVSQGGLKILCSAEIPVGSDVVASLPGLPPSPAVIRWKDGEAYGITFNRALSLPQLVAWLQEQQEQARVSATG